MNTVKNFLTTIFYVSFSLYDNFLLDLRYSGLLMFHLVSDSIIMLSAFKNLIYVFQGILLSIAITQPFVV